MQRGGYQLALDSNDDISDTRVSEYHDAVEKAADRESRNRAYFAQRGIKPDQVQRELREMEPALGSASDILAFIRNAIQRFNGELRPVGSNGVFDLHPGDLRALILSRSASLRFPLRVSFDGVPREGVTQLGRNHPVVAALSDATLERALSGDDTPFARCGAITTDAVNRRTFALLLRLRYLIREGGSEQFAEEVVAAAFQRVGGQIRWLEPYQETALQLLSDTTDRTQVPREEAAGHVNACLRMLTGDDWAKPVITERLGALKASHERLRAELRGSRINVAFSGPPDIIGCWALIPSGEG